MPDVDRLNTVLHDILDAIEAGWPAEAEPLPELKYVANGAVAWDGCELLAVSLVRTLPTPDGDPTFEGMTRFTSLVALRGAAIDIFLLRCVPDVSVNGDQIVMPTPADVEASAAIILADAQALENVIVSASQTGELPGCSTLTLENWTAAGPEGGMGGGVLRIRFGLR